MTPYDDATEQSWLLDGLGSPAEIRIDRWGVAHIYAQSTDDGFFVQGFNAARERLWQMDLWRRRGLGQLAEVFGPDFVERDRATRLFLYRGDMQQEWTSYGPATNRIVARFTDGINAYIRLTEDDPSRLPVEFAELGYRPGRWAPEDVVRVRTNGLFSNLRQEVTRALVLRDFGKKVEELRRKRQPPRELEVPEGLDLSLIPDDVLRVYELATTQPLFGRVGGAAGTVQGGSAQVGTQRGTSLEGSNNWAVAPRRTATGRPILANDPHRLLSLPSLRYIVHLSTPDFDVIGSGEPILPGISIGHNGTIAFGFTVFAIDQEDLYVYATNPRAPREYRYGDRWEPMRLVREEVAVRGSAPVEVELAFTRHGPVIYEDHERCTAFAVRAAWLQPGTAPYLGSLGYMRARNWEEFVRALDRWGTPGENQVFADVSGSIGWKAAGLAPIRPNWDGSLPVPGDGRYEWAGYYSMDKLPAVHDPDRGWVATANEMNLPAGFPPETRISYDWSSPCRAQRIAEILSSNSDMATMESVRLQTDYLSMPARDILRRLREVRSAPPGLVEVLDLLAKWDGTLSAGSIEATIFQVWYRQRLRPEMLRRALSAVVPTDRAPAALEAILPGTDLLGDSRVDLELLGSLGTRFGPNGQQVFDELLLETLANAVGDVEGLRGQSRDSWQWGQLHTARFAHPLLGSVSDAVAERLRVPPVPRGGSGDTVGNTVYTPDYVQNGGSTFRMVLDVGGWDGSLAMNAPGQSGDPDSPHYADLLAMWARDEAFPLVYSRQRVEEVTEKVIQLRPPTVSP
jgi:penicillin G amidase